MMKEGARMMRNRNTVRFMLAILLLLFALTACTQSADNDEIKAIRTRGVLRVGVKVDVPRFGYLNPDTNVMEGIEVDIAHAIAKDILGDSSLVRFVNITAQTRGPMLDNGEIDLVIATFTITEERKSSFNFSRPYYTDELGYLVRSNSSVASPEDLSGKIIGVTKSSTAKAAFEDERTRLDIEVGIEEYASYPEVKAALMSGKIDAFVTDKSILYGYLDDECELLDTGFNPQQYGIASKLGNDKLASRVDSLLETFERNGELGELLKEWAL